MPRTCKNRRPTRRSTLRNRRKQQFSTTKLSSEQLRCINIQRKCFKNMNNYRTRPNTTSMQCQNPHSNENMVCRTHLSSNAAVKLDSSNCAELGNITQKKFSTSRRYKCSQSTKALSRNSLHKFIFTINFRETFLRLILMEHSLCLSFGVSLTKSVNTSSKCPEKA